MESASPTRSPAHDAWRTRRQPKSRERILRGDLAPGSLVTHESLATLLDISTMPVREALLRLSHEGFIAKLSGIGPTELLQ